MVTDEQTVTDPIGANLDELRASLAHAIERLAERQSEAKRKLDLIRDQRRRVEAALRSISSNANRKSDRTAHKPKRPGATTEEAREIALELLHGTREVPVEEFKKRIADSIRAQGRSCNGLHFRIDELLRGDEFEEREGRVRMHPQRANKTEAPSPFSGGLST